MYNHNKKTKVKSNVDLGFLLILYRGRIKKINLKQPLFCGIVDVNDCLAEEYEGVLLERSTP